MAVPDEVFFGPDNITFGMLRASEQNPDLQLNFLKKRMESFFINQIDQLGTQSPFVKAIMCCIAMETLGNIFFQKNSDDQAAFFIQIAAKIDQKLSRPLSKEFKTNYSNRWPEKIKLEANTRAGILYSYLRNTMVHGYYAQGVYLTDEPGTTWSEHSGYLLLNPHWLWEEIKNVYSNCIEKAIEGKKEPRYRANALTYLKKIGR